MNSNYEKYSAHLHICQLALYTFIIYRDNLLSQLVIILRLSQADVVRQVMEEYGFSRPAAEELVARSMQKAVKQSSSKKLADQRGKKPYIQFLNEVSPEMDWDSKMARFLASVVDRVIEGSLINVAISLPPRVGKSEQLTKRLPVHWLESRPTDKVIVGGYNHTLAKMFTGSAMKMYRERNPDNMDGQAEDDWGNTEGGTVRAVGVGSGVTGHGGDCLVASTKIRTLDGLIDISQLAIMDNPPPVICFDHKNDRISIGDISASREIEANFLVTIHTRDGRNIKGTLDHQVFTDSGYLPMSSLTVGMKVKTNDGWDHVEIVMRGDASEPVYDIQVDSHHNFIANDLLVHNCIIIDDPIKPLPVDTPVPTPSGWITMGEIKPGDVVFDHAGNPCNVIDVTERFIGPRWEIEFSDRSTIGTHPSHPWLALSRRSQDVYCTTHDYYGDDWWKWGNRGKSKAVTVTAEEMSKTLVARKTMRNWTIPNAQPLNLPDIDLPIDPYILGYWLGDGDTKRAFFTVHKDDYESFSYYLKAAGYFEVKKTLFNGDTTWRVSTSTIEGGGNKWVGSLTRVLQSLGLIDSKKFIPKMYLRASVRQRLALLRGLMDSDGTLVKGECEVVFSNSNLDLADGVAELFNSLGAKVGRSGHQPEKGDYSYRVRAYPTFNPFALPRKANNFVEEGQIRRRNRTVVDVRDTGEICEHVCITVDSESHLFLAGKQMVPTHNSHKEAFSAAYRAQVWNWYLNDLRSRRNNLGKTPQIIIGTRWHREDLIGKILSNAEKDEWLEICIPAIAGENDPLGRAPGESINPIRLPIKELTREKKLLGRRFDALFQQKPIDESGAMFNIEKLVEVPDVPIMAHRCRFWDRAASEGAGDYTVGVLMAYDDNGIAWIEDVIRGQWESSKVREKMRETLIKDTERYGKLGRYKLTTCFEREPGGDGKTAAADIVRMMAPFVVYADQPSDNKTARASGFAIQINAGNVRMKIADWNDEYTNELSRFVADVDNGQDDQVDSSSGAFNKLAIENAMVTIG